VFRVNLVRDALAGAIMNASGISRRLIAFASALLGFVRGGLAMVNVATSLFFCSFWPVV
jgi:TRAP-type C4-dicarboxylate transport system permease large subunit